MMRRRPSPLRRKIMLVVLSTTLGALLMSGAIVLLYELHSYRQAWVADLTSQAELVARASATALSFDDPKAAAENLSMLRLRPQVRAAAVYTADGRVFARSWTVTPGGSSEGRTATESTLSGSPISSGPGSMAVLLASMPCSSGVIPLGTLLMRTWVAVSPRSRAPGSTPSPRAASRRSPAPPAPPRATWPTHPRTG